MANSKKYENFAARPLGNTVVVDWHNQPRDQRGTPGGEGFLRGAQIFWTMSKIVKLYPTHFSRGRLGLRPTCSPAGYGPGHNPKVRDAISSYSQLKLHARQIQLKNYATYFLKGWDRWILRR